MDNKTSGGDATPLHIEIALHYSKPHNSEPAAFKGHDSNAMAQVHREFAAAGLLEVAEDKRRWKATARMRLYLEELCKVPLPAKQNVNISQPGSKAETGKGFIGNETINTRNTKIATAMDEYLASTPQSRLWSECSLRFDACLIGRLYAFISMPAASPKPGEARICARAEFFRTCQTYNNLQASRIFSLQTYSTNVLLKFYLRQQIHAGKVRTSHFQELAMDTCSRSKPESTSTS